MMIQYSDYVHIVVLLYRSIFIQAELFSRAAKHLQDIVNTLPQDKVAQVRSRVDQVIYNKGIDLSSIGRNEAFISYQQLFNLFFVLAVYSPGGS